jgi:uncharacterized protein (DUF305 family)
MAKSLAIALIIVAFVIGIGAGYILTPFYSMDSYSNSHMSGLGQADRYVDLRYIDAMIAHHLSAIKLAEQAKKYSGRQEIISLADEIIKNEPSAINELYAWKKEWFNNGKKIAASEVPNLGSFDEKFDLRFLNAIIAHHEEGIKMTKEIRYKSLRPEILNNADDVENFLKNSISMLSQWRSQWYPSIEGN